MSLLSIALFSIFVSFLVTFITMPFLIRRLERRGIVGVDMNKHSKPKIAEMGGIGVWAGFAFAVMLAIASFTYLKIIEIDLTILLAAFATVTMVCFLGAIDDIIGWRRGIRQWQHALLPVFASLPLMAVNINNPPLVFPFIGALPEFFVLPFFGMVSFGVIYSLFIVPLGITGASNGVNMLAGMNGLEAGLGAIITATMLLIAFLFGKPEAVIILASMLGALIAFLRYNWFPAKVFGGDSLTLMYGANIAAAAIIADMEKTGVLLIALFFVELVLKGKHRFQSESFAVPQKNGLLMPNPKGGSLTHAILRIKPMTEVQLVKTILGMQLIVSLFVLAMFFAGYLR